MEKNVVEACDRLLKKIAEKQYVYSYDFGGLFRGMEQETVIGIISMLQREGLIFEENKGIKTTHLTEKGLLYANTGFSHYVNREVEKENAPLESNDIAKKSLAIAVLAIVISIAAILLQVFKVF